MKVRLAQLFPALGALVENNGAADDAVLKERYVSLKRQVPILYAVAVANLCGLWLATEGNLNIGQNFPTFLIIFAGIRIVQWLMAPTQVSHATMQRRLRQSTVFALVLCVGVSAWCIQLMIAADASTRMAIILFGGFTAIGTAYGLSVLPIAARIPIYVLAFPLAGTVLISREPQLIGASLSLALVALMILRLLVVQNSHFIEVIKSRTVIASERSLAERAREEAIHKATTDFLTGLPNRRAFMAALDATSRRVTKTFAVAILDLNNFKSINDSLGHLSGDEALKVAAARLVEFGGASVVTARLGGDEFGMIFEHISETAHAYSLGLSILTDVGRSAMINGREVTIEASIGIGFSKASTSLGPSRILSDADLALYEAKQKTGAHVAVFEPRMEVPHQRRSQLERAVRDRSFKQRIELVYQPIFELASGAIVAVEALARLNDHDLGPVSPSEFMPIAEQLGVIETISDHLLRIALAEAAHWSDSIRLSFNVSAVQLSSPGIVHVIACALDEAGLGSHRLQVEVTETALLSDIAQAKANLSELKAAGVTIVLDDFGAGFSSVGYLRELSFDQIKLDGVLLTAAESSDSGRRLLEAVIGFCTTLGVTTVAEHVESEEQRQLVRKLGCFAGQGYWLQPPLSALEVRACLPGPVASKMCSGSLASRNPVLEGMTDRPVT